MQEHWHNHKAFADGSDESFQHSERVLVHSDRTPKSTENLETGLSLPAKDSVFPTRSAIPTISLPGPPASGRTNHGPANEPLRQNHAPPSQPTPWLESPWSHRCLFFGRAKGSEMHEDPRSDGADRPSSNMETVADPQTTERFVDGF